MRGGARQLAVLAMAFEAWFVIALIALHILRPDLAPSRTMISRYAVGPYGGLMTSAFVAAAIADLMLLLGLLRVGPTALGARAAEVVLGIRMVGLLTSAVFPMDVPPAPATLAGSIHEVSFMVNVPCSVLAALLLATSLGSDARWRPFRRTAWALTLAEVVTFVLTVVAIRVHRNYGVISQLYAATLVIWVFAVALRMRAISPTGDVVPAVTPADHPHAEAARPPSEKA
jgi:uncharacterized protein DUF998